MLGYCLKHSGLWAGLGQIFLVSIDAMEYHPMQMVLRCVRKLAGQKLGSEAVNSIPLSFLLQALALISYPSFHQGWIVRRECKME